MVATASPAIAKATATVLKLSKDERARMLHEAEVKARRDERARFDYAMEIGIAKVRAEERITFARNLLNMKMPLAKIAKATGLNLEEIKKLAH